MLIYFTEKYSKHHMNDVVTKATRNIDEQRKSKEDIEVQGIHSHFCKLIILKPYLIDLILGNSTQAFKCFHARLTCRRFSLISASELYN